MSSNRIQWPTHRRKAAERRLRKLKGLTTGGKAQSTEVQPPKQV